MGGRPRHAQLVCRELGLLSETGRSSKGVVTPGVKSALQPLQGDELEESKVVTFKSLTMGLAFLAVDRLDIQYASKDVVRAMSRPTIAAWESFSPLGRTN